MPRDCYRMLFGEMLAESETFDEVIGTGWTYHMMTSEFCPKCLAEDAESTDEEGDR